MSDRPTPETDRERRKVKRSKSFPTDPVSAEFARNLERQRDDAMEISKKYEDRYFAMSELRNNASLVALEYKSQLDKAIASEHATSAAYVRLRVKLGALDTPHAPTCEQIWKHTEEKLDELIAQRDKLRDALESLVDCISETRGKDAYDALEKAKYVLGKLLW